MGEVTIPKAQSYTDTQTVLAVQRALAAKGFSPGTIDGKYGPKTKDALRSWQYESGSDAVDGVITYGVLLQLGIAPPGTPSSAASDAAAVQAATAAMHAGTMPAAETMYAPKKVVASTREIAAAKQAVDVAKAKVEVATNPMAKNVAEQQLAQAEQRLEAIDPSTPWWQYALAVGGVGAIGIGMWSLFGKRGRRG